MNALAHARALHMLAVLIWIGGVSMVTTVVLPALRRGELDADSLIAFATIEGRFVWQARAAVLIAGVTGFYMVIRLDLWSRFRAVEFWWMHAMLVVWFIFALALFVIEPLGLHRRLRRASGATPQATLLRLHRVHLVLLALALVTVLAAVAGSHGWVF